MNSILQDAETIQADLVDHRRYLHHNPETGLHLPVTSEYVFKALEAMGCHPKRITDSGIVALIGKGVIDKTILLRADMDALKITEEADIEYRSVNGNMHACGHDFHMTMLLGAAKLLKSREHELEGYVKLMFQPAEETFEGAKEMIEAGILQNPKVDAAMGIHVATGVPLPAGIVIVPEAGPSMAGADWFKITVKGKGCHGAMPYTGVDPLNVIANIYFALQELISREVDALDTAVLTVGFMRGGSVNNVIPETAELGGTLRTFTKKNREFIVQRVREVAEGMATTYRAEATVEFSNGTPSLVNDPASVLFAKEYLADYFGEHSFLTAGMVIPGGKAMGSEDFAFVSQEVPTIQLTFGAGDSQKGCIHPLHHPKAMFEESVLARGAALFAGYAVEWLKRNI